MGNDEEEELDEDSFAEEDEASGVEGDSDGERLFTDGDSTFLD